MRRISFVVFALGISWSLSCFAQSPRTDKPSFTRLDKIIAIVNREPITLSQYNKEMEHAKKQLEHTHQSMTAQAELKKLVLDNLIAKKLQMQLCQTRGLKVTDEDVNKAIQNIATSNKASLTQLKEAIKQAGMNYDDYTAQIRDQLLLQKLQQEEVAKTVSLTPDDVKQFMRENKDKFNQYSAFHVIDVVLPANETMSSDQVAQVKKQAAQLSAQLQTSKEMDVTIKQYSAEKNDLGWRSLAEIPSIFQSKVATMKIHAISAPLQAPNGFHILKLLEAKGESLKPTQAQIKNVVFQNKMNDAIKVWVQKLRNDAFIKIVN